MSTTVLNEPVHGSDHAGPHVEVVGGDLFGLGGIEPFPVVSWVWSLVFTSRANTYTCLAYNTEPFKKCETFSALSLYRLNTDTLWEIGAGLSSALRLQWCIAWLDTGVQVP